MVFAKSPHSPTVPSQNSIMHRAHSLDLCRHHRLIPLLALFLKVPVHAAGRARRPQCALVKPPLAAYSATWACWRCRDQRRRGLINPSRSPAEGDRSAELPDRKGRPVLPGLCPSWPAFGLGDSRQWHPNLILVSLPCSFPRLVSLP
jgi:hypothetical protein